MKKNVAIVLLSIALATSIGMWGNSASEAVKMRAASRLVRQASIKVWLQACEHAADGDKKRARWCGWATEQTRISAADEGVTDSDLRAFATDVVIQEMKAKNAK